MVRLCVPLDLDELASFAYEHNQLPISSCAFCFKGYDAIRNEFLGILCDDKMNIFGDYENDKLKGLLGFWIDEEKQTVDCIGPFAMDDNFIDIAVRLFQYATIHYKEDYTYNFFFNIMNQNYLQFVHSIDGKDTGNEYELNILREDYKENSIQGNIVPFVYSYKESLIHLHDKECQAIYISGDELIQSIEHQERRVYLAIENGTLIGYGVLKLRGNTTVAGAEIITMDEKFKGKGYEKLILYILLREGFTDMNVNSIYSVVEKHNASYLNLFLQEGFQIKEENCSYSYKRG